MVGLSNVDNTSDINKPISTLTQNALDLKASLSNPTFTGTVSGITKAMVGLSNVDNTADLNKPISTAVQTALDLKASQSNPTFTGTVSGITKAMVGLSNVDNTSDINKPISTATQNALNEKATKSNPTFTGTVSGITKAMVGLSEVDNTSDINKPISTPVKNALDLKAPLSNPTFTGTLKFDSLYNVIPINNGGTGKTTRQEGLNALCGSATNKYYLRGDGTNVTMSQLNASDLNGPVRVFDAYYSSTWFTLNDSYSNSIITTEWGGQPVFPNNLSVGFTCTIINYSNYTWESNTLSGVKFYSSSTGVNGATKFSLPSFGSATINVVNLATVGLAYVVK
jgi:hypothetical protein